MGVTKIGHTGMKVKDMDASLKFYCDGLGMKKKFSMCKEDGTPWIEYLEFGQEQFVELFYSYEKRKEHPALKDYYAMYHMALVTDDIHQMETHLKAIGIIPQSGPVLGPDQTWQMWVKDPDGNDIELMEYTKDSLQLKREE